MRLKKPIEVKLEITWVFVELPDQFKGTRKEAFEYCKNYVLGNMGDFLDGIQIENHLTAY
jgi:hypothetical protein